MTHYTKLLLSFILSTVMDKNDYDFFHKNFKPVRVVFILILVLNVPFTIYLIDRLHDTVKELEVSCPNHPLVKVDVVVPKKK